jgi:ribosomal-protein-alanine N-acetyltransferase
MKGLPLELEDLYIQELSMQNCESFLELMNMEEVQEYIPDRFENLEELRECIEWLISNYRRELHNIVRLTFAIKSKSNQDLIGWVSYGPLPSNEELNEIAYAIHPKHWMNGYASSSLRAFINWLNTELQLNELYAEVDCSNMGSIKVLHKNGFNKISTFVDEKGNTKYLYKYQRNYSKQ